TARLWFPRVFGVPRKNRLRGPSKNRKKNDFSREIAAFGEFVRTLRQELGITIEELAERADLSNNHVSEIERAKTNPRLDTIEALAAALGLAPRALVDETQAEAEAFGPKGREFVSLFEPLPPDLQADIVLILRMLTGRHDD
ncbi:MAG: helix-turn-helix domain-containing protein, partial [Polyangiaceae bacterium]|nr:helix-turn-helix domain-containing protein [Polyangiaceae bacterium]